MQPLVGIIMGSVSDWDTMRQAAVVLEEFQVPHERRVVSAHRTPEWMAEYATTAVSRNLQVIIAGAGHAAHLAGAMAAHTTLPVIGVPIDSSCLHGMDALLSTVQMPPGIPVATMAIGKSGAKNAGISSIMLLTGFSSRNDIQETGIQPDYVFADITELAHVLRAAHEATI